MSRLEVESQGRVVERGCCLVYRNCILDDGPILNGYHLGLAQQ